jgi:hypothetical protein
MRACALGDAAVPRKQLERPYLFCSLRRLPTCSTAIMSYFTLVFTRPFTMLAVGAPLPL